MSARRGDGLALVLIDLQKAYFEFPELAKEEDRLLRRANELVAQARDAGRLVVLVRTQHERDRSTWTISMLDDGEGSPSRTPSRPPTSTVWTPRARSTS